MNNRKYILSTASLDPALMELLHSNNIKADAFTFIKTTPGLNNAAVTRIKELEEQNVNIVFTSANGVKAVAAVMTIQPEWNIWCISGQTTDAVKEYFTKAVIAGTAINADELSDKIIAGNIKELVFFCASERSPVLPAKLTKHKIDLEEIIAYSTTLTPQVVNKKYDGILFLSASAVKSFFSVNTINNQTICFAIGDTTAAAIKEKCSNKIVVSSFPSKKEMIDLVIQYYHEHNRN